MAISLGALCTLLVGFLAPRLQDCLVVLDVPALQHVVCGGVLVMVVEQGARNPTGSVRGIPGLMSIYPLFTLFLYCTLTV